MSVTVLENDDYDVMFIKCHSGVPNEDDVMSGIYGTYGEVRNTYKILIRKPERTRQFGGSGHGCVVVNDAS